VPTQSGPSIAALARELLLKTDAGARAVRLLGVSTHNLQPVGAAEDGPPRLPFYDE
jgi:hypothetical protein